MEDLLICRCEEIYRSEILQAIRDGAKTANEVKRFTGAGMGLCQGRTCRKLIEAIIAQETELLASEIAPASYRIPARPVNIASVTEGKRGDEES
jgi:NAD(P)H-nitrite reductase large subunit